MEVSPENYLVNYIITKGSTTAITNYSWASLDLLMLLATSFELENNKTLCNYNRLAVFKISAYLPTQTPAHLPQPLQLDLLS